MTLGSGVVTELTLTGVLTDGFGAEWSSGHQPQPAATTTLLTDSASAGRGEESSKSD